MAEAGTAMDLIRFAFVLFSFFMTFKNLLDWKMNTGIKDLWGKKRKL